MLGRFSEANARVQYNLVATYSAIAQSLYSLPEKLPDFPGHAVIGRVGLHRLGRSLHVHADVAGTHFADDSPHGIVNAIGGDVVDDARASLKSGASERGFHSINGDWDLDASCEQLDNRYDPAQFFRFGYWGRAWASRFSAY